MMRQPVKPQAQRGRQKAVTYTLASPTGGWNAKDQLADMPPLDAVKMENWFPGTSEVQIRRGARDWVNGFAPAPDSVFGYNGATVNKLFAANTSGIYDVTTDGAVGSVAVAATAGGWQTVNFATTGGSFLICVNGVDSMKQFDGTAWASITAISSPIAITGLATSSLTNVAAMANRLWFAVTNDISPWYLDVGAIGGTLTKFPLGAVFSKGGTLVAMLNWSVDGGSGPDDYSCFVTSEGQVAIYRGTDPSSSTTWSKVGVYDIGRPLGRRCLTKFGGDILVLTQTGIYPLSKSLLSASINRTATISSKIDLAFIAAAEIGEDLPGWDIAVYPAGSFIIVNVPTTALVTEQYVMNTVTNSWCKFTNWNLSSLCVFQRKLYFTSQRGVALAWQDSTDFNGGISADVIQAYNSFRNPSTTKLMTLIRPIITLQGDQQILVGLATDYRLPLSFSTTPLIDEVISSVWDVALWDQALWAGGPDVVQEWGFTNAYDFYAAAICLRITSAVETMSWTVTNLAFQTGGVL